MFHRYYTARHFGTKFRSSAIFNCPCLCGRFKDWPIEAFFKLFCISIGFFLEIYTGFSQDWRFVNIGNGQHATMFFFFGMTGVIDLLLHYKWPLPPNMDYVMMLLAVLCEFILFKFHLHGREDLDVLLHTLLLYAIAAGMICIVLEMRYKDNILCALSRAYCTVLQGTWFWQIGWILYPPFPSSFRWDQDDHQQMMIATMIFAWHAAVVLLVMLAIGGVVAFLHRRVYGYHRDTDGYVMKRLIQASSNGDTIVRLNADDSESEIEFEKSALLSS